MFDLAHLTGMKHGSHQNKPDREEVVRLAERASAGCRSSFERLARNSHPRLLAHAYRLLGHREQAKDAAQSAWLEIAKGIRNLRDARAFPAWSFRIVTRRCAHHISNNQADRILMAALLTDATETAGTEREDRDDLIELKRAVATLPPDQRAAIALFYHEGMSVAETAVALDVPVGTIKTRLMHARRKLAALLEGEDK